MDIPRNPVIIILMLVSFSATVFSTPVDSTRDLLQSVENCDGKWFLELVSESLRLQIESGCQQLKDIAKENPGLAETLLDEMNIGLTMQDMEWMTTGDFVSRMLEKVYLPPFENIVSEETSMNGRNSVVVFTWSSGYSLTVRLSWEESSWKVSGSPVVDQLF